MRGECPTCERDTIAHLDAEDTPTCSVCGTEVETPVNPEALSKRERAAFGLDADTDAEPAQDDADEE